MQITDAIAWLKFQSIDTVLLQYDSLDVWIKKMEPILTESRRDNLAKIFFGGVAMCLVLGLIVFLIG